MDYTERVKSKNWKERQEAYQELGVHFKEGRHLEILPLLQNEVNIPALESAIDAILQAPIISTSQVSKIFLQIGNAKVKGKVVQLISAIKDSDLTSKLLELVRSKNPKVVSSVIPTLPIDLTVLEEGTLEVVLNHPDKAVRSEGIKLAKELYKKVGNRIKPYLANIKPIIIKELDLQEDKVQVDLDLINDPKWNIRLSVLESILTNTSFTDTDLIVNRINDPNNQVFFLVLEVIKKFSLKSQKVVNKLLERLKDKKGSITERIKDTLVHLKVDQVPPSFFLSKSPELKCNIIDLCIRCGIKGHEVLETIEKCREDSSGAVRSKALEALKEFNTTKSDSSTKRDSITKRESNIKRASSTKMDSITKSNVVKSDSKNFINNAVKSDPDIKIVRKSSISSKNSDRNSKRSVRVPIQVCVNKAILESFHEKYPFIAEKTWSIRLEGLRANLHYLKKEDITDLSNFIYSTRDPNFQVNIQYIDLLLSRKKEIERVEILVHYCIEKCTEVKMRSKILELLRAIDTGLVVEILVEEASKIKKGKKFVEILKILENYSEREEVEGIFKIPVTGLQEKKGMEELKKRMEEEKKGTEEEKKRTEEEKMGNMIEENKTQDDISISQYHISSQKDESLTSQQDKSLTSQQDKSLTSQQDKSLVSQQDELPLENTTKKTDLASLMEEGDIYSVINLLPSLDTSSLSRIISFLIFKDVQSTFFNSLMVHCISRKYILTEDECLLLVRHFLSREYCEEFSMVDRVYPVTKLFLILKTELEKGEGEDCILKLIEKYINIEDREELKRKVLESKDFLNLIDRVNNKEEEVINNKEDINNNKEDIYNNNKVNYKKDINNKKDINKKDINKGRVNTEDILIAPSVYEDLDLNIDIETSLDCLNLSMGSRLTPNVKKFRKEFNSPMKNIENLEDILDNIIDSDQRKSEEAFRRLSEIIKKDINTVLFSANSIISSISIQLLDVLHRPLYAKLILNVLLRLSQSKIFCEQLRRETLESCNIDLINILMNEELSDVVSDILTNLCINSKMSIILEVYLNLINDGDIPLKLIWRHSKSMDMKNTEEIQRTIGVLEDFYKKSVYTNILENITTFKIVILHLREICVYYQEKTGHFEMGRYVKKIVEKILNDEEVNIKSVRK